jgi:hypothetical protein
VADKRLKMPIECAQVVIKYDLDGQPCENVFYVQKQHQDTVLAGFSPAAFDSGAADTVAGKVKTWLTDQWADIAHVLAAATEVQIVWSTSAGTGPLEGKVYQDSDYPIVGTNEGEPLPNNCTVAMSLRTALLGRSYHGRMYVVGLNDGQIDAGAPNQLKTTSLSDLPTAFENLRTTVGDDVGTPPVLDKFPLGVMSYVHAGSARSTALFTQATAFVLTDPYLDSMRRRLPAHNRHR